MKIGDTILTGPHAGKRIVALSVVHGYILESGIAQNGDQLEFRGGGWRMPENEIKLTRRKK